MPSRSRVFSSSVGTKILIGLTGVALFLYLLIHIAGNPLVFFGPAVFNRTPT
jgi:succinate dehydrogenase / fumarate reductase cytochrome b subunit